MERHFAQRELDELLDQQLNRQREDDEVNNNNNNNNNEEEDAMQPPLALDNNEGQGATIINLRLKYRLIPVYFSVGFSFIGGYLFFSYALPSAIGYVLNFIYLKLVLTLFRGTSILASYMKLSHYNSIAVSKVLALKVIEDWIISVLVQPILKYYSGYMNGDMKHSILIRAFAPLTTYLTFIAICCIIPEVLSKGHSKKNPLRNSLRRNIFKASYIIKCTLKVFTLFTFELAGFPILAGYMIDLSLISPLLIPQNEWTFIPKFLSHRKIFVFLAYWAIGSLYMYWFAQYVGMVRQYIIRPGVLFFIRSPDDPNIKLLQDSLLYPMKMQLSRLALSMFIYTAFILVGFGFHTRLLFPHILKTNFLPIERSLLTFLDPTTHAILPVLFVTYYFLTHQRVINVYVRQYWVYIFELCCRKIRLSSFILDKESAMERGHVVYRNLFFRVFASGKARMSNLQLYSHPKSFNEAKTLFNTNPQIHAYFVPDGNMMRVPASDIISKKYAQFLFVPVTKDDKLLKPLDIERIKKRQRATAGEFGYLENQLTEFDEYKVVYVPPNFTRAYSLLLVLIWVFASLLMIGTVLISNICGMPMVKFVELIIHYILPSKALKTIGTNNIFSLDLFSICIGLILMSFGLTSYHNYVLNRVQESGHIVNVVEDADNDLANLEGENDQLIGERQPVENIENFAIIEMLKSLWNSFVVRLLLQNILIYGWIVGLVSFNITYHSTCFETLFMAFYLSGSPISDRATISNFSNDAEMPLTIFNSEVSHWIQWMIIFFFQASIISFITFAKPARNNEQLSIMNTIFRLLKANIAYSLSLLLIPIVFQMIVCLLEYYFTRSAYTSFWAVPYYLITVKPFLVETSVDFTILEHIFYLMEPLTLIASISYLILSFLVFVWRQITQRVKDEVYAKGRTLENLDNY